MSATAAGLGALFFALYFLPALLNRPLCEVPEARVAQAAREMLASGQWIVPTLGGERRGFKPPLPYWLTALSARTLDPQEATSEFTMARAVQLPSAVSCALTVIFVTLFAGMALGWPAGFASGILLGLSWFVVRFGRLGYVDTTLMCACALVVIGAALIVCSRRPPAFSALVLGIGFGLAVLVKEPIPFLVLGGAMAAEVLLRRRWNTRKVLLVVLAALVAIVTALPWFILLAERTDGGWAALIAERRGMWQAGHLQSDRWTFYFKKLGEAWVPWTPLLFLAVLCALGKSEGLGFMAWLKRGIERHRSRFADMEPMALLRFLALVSGLGLLAFYASPKQQDHYLLPLLPAFALLGGGFLSAFSSPGGRREERMAWCQLAFGLLGATILVAAPLWFRRAGSPGLGWDVSIPTGLAFLAVHFHSARQWVEGRPGRALIAPALLFLVVFTVVGIEWSKRKRAESAYAREGPTLQALLGGETPERRTYFIAGPYEILMFYLDRPVRTLDHLGAEAADDPARRLLILRKADLAGRAPWVEAFVQGQQAMATTESFAVYFLPPEVDWPARARATPVWGRTRSLHEE